MQIYRSNRTAKLFDSLVERIESSPLRPLDEEVFVVPNRQMARWLKTSLAERLGVCANARFWLPRKAVTEITKKIAPFENTQASIFEPSTLKWTIASILIRDANEHYLEELAPYVKAHQNPRGS